MLNEPIDVGSLIVTLGCRYIELEGERLVAGPMSSLGWIDFDEAERDRAQRIMALFQERESRDELGLGAIRDSIADHLFPGTSTIQTRLRYMLFVPWLLRLIEDRHGAPNQLMDEAR